MRTGARVPPLVALAILGAASGVVAQEAGGRGRVRLAGVVRNPTGAPVPGAVVQTIFPRQVTFTGSDGRFELPEPVSWDSGEVWVVHLAFARQPARVFDLPRAPDDSTLTLVEVQPAPVDTTSGPTLPPFRITARSIPDAELELITRAARLPQPRGREIRVFIHGGDGTWDRAAILRRIAGHVSGEVWLWWLLDPASGLDAANGRRGANSFGCFDAPWQWATVVEDSIPAWRAVLVCRATLPVTPDWRSMWRRLDSLGVWRLPDQTARLHNRRPFLRGGAFVTLELFAGKRHRVIRHGDPDSITAPGAQQAAAIARALDDAFRAADYAPARWTPRPIAFHISGSVRDTLGEPVEGALVRVPALPFSVRTGADGGFDVAYPVPFTASLAVEGEGYRPVRYPILELPRATYARGSYGIRTEIVLPPAPDSTGTTIHIRGHTGPPGPPDHRDE